MGEGAEVGVVMQGELVGIWRVGWLVWWFCKQLDGRNCSGSGIGNGIGSGSGSGR